MNELFGLLRSWVAERPSGDRRADVRLSSLGLEIRVYESVGDTLLYDAQILTWEQVDYARIGVALDTANYVIARLGKAVDEAKVEVLKDA